MGSDFVRALVVAPHPDDEVLGAGIWLRRQRDRELHIVHLTDGSPLDMQDALAQHIASREQYAEVRRTEVRAALDLIPIPKQNCVQMDFVDKETYRSLVEVVEALDEVICDLRPDLVLAPSYEGGHPDHDAAAFAVSMVYWRRRSFDCLEFPLYHASEDGEMVIGRFAGGDDGEQVISLSTEEYQAKRAMLDCFPSQMEFLSRFPIGCERFRPAPARDFSKPPHSAPLLYERWGWGISGASWRQHAKEALAQLTGRSAMK